MKSLWNKVLFGLLFIIVQINSYADVVPANLIPINSAAAQTYFADVTLSPYFWNLMQQFTTQNSLSYCGVASSVMVLNALAVPAPVDPLYAPSAYFTQSNFFTPKVIALLPPATVSKQGIGLDKLGQALATYPVKVTVVHADEITLPVFRHVLNDNVVAHQGYIIVNFSRTALGQTGGGHISPLAAYDKRNDKVLLLDVARYRYPAVWVSVPDLYQAMKTLDGTHYRGFVIVKK